MCHCRVLLEAPCIIRGRAGASRRVSSAVGDVGLVGWYGVAAGCEPLEAEEVDAAVGSSAASTTRRGAVAGRRGVSEDERALRRAQLEHAQAERPAAAMKRRDAGDALAVPPREAAVAARCCRRGGHHLTSRRGHWCGVEPAPWPWDGGSASRFGALWTRAHVCPEAATRATWRPPPGMRLVDFLRHGCRQRAPTAHRGAPRGHTCVTAAARCRACRASAAPAPCLPSRPIIASLYSQETPAASVLMKQNK